MIYTIELIYGMNWGFIFIFSIIIEHKLAIVINGIYLNNIFKRVRQRRSGLF